MKPQQIVLSPVLIQHLIRFFTSHPSALYTTTNIPVVPPVSLERRELLKAAGETDLAVLMNRERRWVNTSIRMDMQLELPSVSLLQVHTHTYIFLLSSTHASHTFVHTPISLLIRIKHLNVCIVHIWVCMHVGCL